ncbi:type VII secretion target [Plantactinospora mayteni]|uniref:type VII secretion target n=1 Tax=Plantactinospora mayteni TaxID=566021 RepID=UPI001941AEDD|nr:type VII secretion target [Plantactinospora mayteni]
MSSFKADPAVIREFGATLTGLVNDSVGAQQYDERWLEISASSGPLFQTVFDAVAAIRNQLLLSYTQLENVLRLSAEEVERAAQYYETTDAAAAAQLDQTY